MATTFRFDDREVKTKFGELELCSHCMNQDGMAQCCLRKMPGWIDGWCTCFVVDALFKVLHAKHIAAEAYAAGREDGSMECAQEVIAEERDSP